MYKQFRGGAVVENSSHGLQRNVKFMKEVSQKTGVHVIAGTGENDSYCSLLENINWLILLFSAPLIIIITTTTTTTTTITSMFTFP
jgi:predicted metal-dependent phosphotriesterase family hydrolase